MGLSWLVLVVDIRCVNEKSDDYQKPMTYLAVSHGRDLDSTTQSQNHGYVPLAAAQRVQPCT